MKMLFVVAVGAVGLIACSSGAPSESGQDHAEVLTKGPWLGEAPAASSADETHAAAFGGGGGTYDESYCPSVVGGDGKAAKLLDSVQFECASGTNTPSDTRWSGAIFGGGGGFAYNFSCPTNMLVTGIQGGAGQYVDRLSFKCTDTVGNLYSTGAAGGSGGTFYSFDCPAGQKIIGFGVRHGQYIDAIQPFCGAR